MLLEQQEAFKLSLQIEANLIVGTNLNRREKLMEGIKGAIKKDNFVSAILSFNLMIPLDSVLL